jgi:threonine/homoserine/homoserine lactone efflux protein
VITVGNVLGIIIGVVAVVVGLILLIVWWPMFVKALMALVPILLILIGAGVLVYFISEIKSKLEMKKEEAAPSSGEKKPEQASESK